MDWYNDKYDAFLNALKNGRYEPKCNTVTADIVKTQNEIYRKMVTWETAKAFTPQRILRHGIATIVFWQDGTKTVVKRHADEPDNEYTAFCAALAIKVFGSNSQIKSVLRHKTEEPKEKKNATEKREFREGDRVMYTGGLPYDNGDHQFYPPKGTVGTVTATVKGEDDVGVQWPRGTTSGNGFWWCSKIALEVVK